MARVENDFERRVRESEEALERQALRPDGKRPVLERWWYFVLLSNPFWLRPPLDLLLGHEEFDAKGILVHAALLAVAAAIFAWLRRRAEQRRRAALLAAPATLGGLARDGYWKRYLGWYPLKTRLRRVPPPESTAGWQ